MSHQSKQPNLLFILTDEQKATALGLYGNPVVRTPALERMAAEGTMVEQAFATCPICVPSRGTLLTGRYPHSHGLLFNDQRLPLGIPTIFHLLREEGYSMGFFGKNHCIQEAEMATLWDERFEVSHSGYRSKGGDPRLAEVNAWLSRPELLFAPWAAETNPFPRELCPTQVITEQVLRFVEQASRPFCIWLSYPDPHTPLQAPEPYASLYDPEEVPLPPLSMESNKPERQQIARRGFAGNNVSEAQIRRCLTFYYGMERFIDDCIGQILAQLDELGLRQETLVIFTSDHGDYMGEHRMIRKSLAFYDCLMRVPLLLSWPRQVPSGVRCRRLVSLADLVPTIFDLLGIPIQAGIQGRSLRPLLSEERGVAEDAVFAEGGLPGKPPQWKQVLDLPAGPLDGSYSPWGSRPEAWTGPARMIRTPRYKLVTYANGEGELYDLKADPWELENLYGSENLAQVEDVLRRRLLSWMMNRESETAVALAPRGVGHATG